MSTAFLIISMVIISSFSYPTTISSQHQSSGAPLLLESGSVEIITLATPMLTSETQRIMPYTYNLTYTEKPNSFVVLLEIQDSGPRNFINCKVSIGSSTNTAANIQYDDLSSPITSLAGILVTARIIVFGTLEFPNLKFKSTADYTLEDTPHVWLSPSPFSSGSNVSVFTLINSLKFDVSLVSEYEVNIQSQMNYQTDDAELQISVPHPTLNNQLKEVGFVIVYILYDSTVSFAFETLTAASSPSSATVITPDVQVIVGIQTFKIKEAGKKIQLLLQNNYTSIQLPSSSSLSTSTYNFLAIALYFLPSYKFELTTLISHSASSPTFTLVYQNVPDIGNVDVSQITLNQSEKIKVQAVTIEGSSILVLCSYSSDIQGLPLQVCLTWTNNNTNYLAKTNLALIGNPALMIYSGKLRDRAKIAQTLCEIIQYLYIGGFMLCLITSKMVGIELIFVVQIAFYSMIPMGNLNITFNGLSKMWYVSGYNLKFTSVQQVDLISNYSNLNIRSNFISNINLMLIPLIICPIVYICLLIASHFNNSYKHKPRMKQYSSLFLCESFYTILFFNAFNIYTSLIVDLQSLGKQDPGMIGVAIFFALTPVVTSVLYSIFRSKYNQFKQQLNQTQVRLKKSLEQTKIICSFYPTVVCVEMILIPMFLGSNLLFSSSLYIALFIFVLGNIYIFAVRPYQQFLNNLRLIVNRLLITFMLVFLIISKQKIKADTEADSPFIGLIWGIIIILFSGWIMNISFAVWKLVLWFKKNGIVDMKLYMQQQGEVQKQQASLQTSNPMWYPALEYGIGRQNLLNKQNQRRRINLANIKKKEGQGENQLTTQMRIVQQKLRQQMIN